MAELAARFGVAKHPVYGWDVILIRQGQIPFPGMIVPIHTNAFRISSEHPSDIYSTHVWVGDDPLKNLQVAEAFVSQRLGPALPGGAEYAREWKAGPAALKLSVFPDALRPYPMTNPAHERDPRLKTACSICITPGYRAILSAVELARVRSARILLRLQGERVADSIGALDEARPSPLDAEFARDPVPECERLLGTIALSSDGETIVMCGRALLLIPMSEVVRVEVRKLYPARGPGGSWAQLVCRDPYAADGERSIGLCEGRQANGLDEFAARLSVMIEKPVVINDALPDA